MSHRDKNLLVEQGSGQCNPGSVRAEDWDVIPATKANTSTQQVSGQEPTPYLLREVPQPFKGSAPRRVEPDEAAAPMNGRK